ncbi:MAG: UDP-N-acetylmuramoyl-L-alanyl-D-glutamate--2,6-diaminopimelate ligase [Myxococcota bacterium]
MNVADLIGDAAPDARITGPTGRDVTDVVADSRRVRPGAVFVALRGLTVDGHDFAGQAFEAGAAAVVADTPPTVDVPDDAAWVQVPVTAEALGPLASAFHGHPSRDVKVLAVTGTNGKTTVTWLLEHILTETGFGPGVLGTVEIRYGDVRRPATYTTPMAHELHALLAEFRDAGCTHAVMEASSHGLAQERLGGCSVAVGGFTNLTRDHLDYHVGMNAYRDAKARLFQEYARAGCFNVGDPIGREMAEAFDGPLRAVSACGAPADISARDLVCTLEGSRARLRTQHGELELELPLVGRHNVENALVAVGMADLAGVSLERAVVSLATARPAPGRLERVLGPRHVLVDYAHTPDALDNVLGGLEPLVKGRLICVFGAGGDRDAGKRPEMAAAVARHADVAVLTSDNPRRESPDAIIEDVRAGFPDDQDVLVEADRRAAIRRAIHQAGPDDVVVIAGKGHETTQTVGDRALPFDDREEAASALETLDAGGAG